MAKKQESSSSLVESTNTSKHPDVRIITSATYKEAALALSEAFWDDEVARYFVDVPDRLNWTEKQRWDLHLSIMEYITYAHVLCGMVTASGDAYGAVALWMPPHAHMDSFWVMIRSGLWRLSYKLSPEARHRMFKEFFPLLHDTKAEVLGPDRDLDSWYLVYLGTRPSARRQGHAKKLIQHGVDLADAAGVPTYLESSNVVNVPYYRKFGFEVCKTIELIRSDKVISLDIMIREPGGVTRVPEDRLVEVKSDQDAGASIKVHVDAQTAKDAEATKTKALDIAGRVVFGSNGSGLCEKSIKAPMEKKDSGVFGVSA